MNLDRNFYEVETNYFDDPTFLSRHMAMMESYIAPFRSTLANMATGERKLRLLELGAGTCTLSLVLSREPWVESIQCIDISAKRMDALASEVAKRVSGRIEILSFSEGDISDRLSFEDGQFDAVLFDAALHHSRNIWLTLKECHRVLRHDGVLIAQREQYVARLTSQITLGRILRSREVRAGVSENAYSKEQYDYYLRANGFRPTFKSVAPGWLSWISFLNGLVFSKWTIIAVKRSETPVFD